MTDLISVLLWIIGITSITLVGSLYARKYEKPDLLIALYVTFCISAQILAVKITVFDFGFKQFFVPAGVLVFSITYLLTDIVNEKFGRKETHKMIFIAFITQIAISLFSLVILSLNPASFSRRKYWSMKVPSFCLNIASSMPKIT